jgi:hypothetical protein
MDLKALENLLIARIESQLPYLESVRAFDGVVGVDIDELIVYSPMALVNILRVERDAAFETFTTRAYKHRVNIGVIVRSAQGSDSAIRDQAGVYRIINDLRTALIDYQLSSLQSPILLIEEAFSNATKAGAFYKISLQLTDIEEV